MTVTYRTPGAEDAEALAELSRTTFIDTFGHLYTAENLNAFLETSYSVDAIAAEIDNPHRLINIAAQDGQMVGYCKLSFDVTLDTSAEWRNGIEVKQLYLRPSQFGSGTADALMIWAINEARARASKSLVLSVWSENFRAQRFYQRYGFAHIGDTTFMVGDQSDDEFLYGLRLSAGTKT
jgi:diamine N-acetyltransferase